MVIRKIAKALKLKELSSHFNFTSTIHLNGKKYRIPILRNMGLLNLSVKKDWFTDLLVDLKLPKNASFIDIGVNVGQTLLTFRSCYDNPYWGFEPNPNCVYYLSALIKANNFRSVNIIPVGLSGESQIARFFLKNDADSAGTIVQELRPDYYDSKNVSYVPLYAFDTLKLPEIGTIGLIKIDVEGAELDVLTGLKETLKKQKPPVICEVLDCHSRSSEASMQARADKLGSLMREIGYSIYRIRHEGKITYEKIDAIKLKLWTPESFDLNDYLFLPVEKSPV